MLFNSFEFLVFFPIVFIIYWLLNNDLQKQNILLLVSSYIFYAWWDWRFLSLIIVSSFIDYTAGSKIFHAKTERQSKNWLLISLIANLGLLGFFKYYNFFADSFSTMMTGFGWQPNDLTLNIILPVGISFYTFQTLSYTIDIYRKQFEPTKNMVSFFTYIAFFPQLVAGPIERASNLLPQIEKKRILKKEWFNEGLIQILVGLFRKIVIADTIGAYVDTVYSDVGIYNSTTIVVATFLYAFQIYFDFAGYSDIAIGTAKLMGFKFNQNFNLPYFSISLTEFWRKWHMSLSFWLRDYLYISLGGNRKGIKITYRNLMLTMLLGGLWHGSSWNFVIWGGIHGLILSIEKFIKTYQTSYLWKKFSFLGYPITFGVVLFSWIFFRAQDLNSAMLAIKKICQFNFSAPFIGDINLIITSALVLSLGIGFDFFLFRKKIDLENLAARFSILKVAVLASVIIVLINLFYSTSNNFIYFQF
ncbi:MBOAT family O-acyltransferase [Bizionia myxarmorum]|uniref:MBOAT family protein n=1 Tax=Bizionia myxarmorum TaxID=291186 RepID=A0A5D0RAH2_9FLAO|nr:MBOAT family O-acyltransferase [Bizionia myxarmorum]TYB78353.1 MBOAT family protein [Bizionia myxarmorum]